MAEAVTQGLVRTKEAEAATQIDGEVMKVLVGVKDLIAGALFLFPPTAAAWTGLMVVFGGFVNAAQQSGIQRDGILYVGSLVMWYCKLFDHHPDQRSAAIGERLSDQLATQFVRLCQKMTEYQMRSVVYYYRNWFDRSIRGAFKFDAWGEALDGVKVEEELLRNRLESYYAANEPRELMAIREEIKGYFSKLDPAIASTLIGDFKWEGLDYDRFKNENDLVESSSCEWILNDADESFKRWDKEGGLMLVQALPGQGKSAFASFAVDKWKKEHTMCHFFFKDESAIQNQLSSGLCAVLHQLLEQNKYLASIQGIQEKVKSGGHGLFKSVDALWSLFVDALQLIGRPVMIIFDALDECRYSDEPSNEETTSHSGGPGGAGPSRACRSRDREILLEKLLDFCRGGLEEVKILATTRLDSKVSSYTNDFRRTSGFFFVDLNSRQVELRVVIGEFIDKQFEALAGQHQWDESMRKEIKKVLKGDNGNEDQLTFLWVQLVFYALRPREDLTLTAEQWIDLIKTSTSISVTYEKLLDNVLEVVRKDVEKLFTLMMAAREPLTLAEVSIAMKMTSSWKPGDIYLPCQDKENPFKEVYKWITKNTCSVVTIRNDRVHFIHGTVKEFLKTPARLNKAAKAMPPTPSWEGFRSELEAHRTMRSICSKYIHGHISGLNTTGNTTPGGDAANESIPLIDLGANQDPNLGFMGYAASNYAFHWDRSNEGPSWDCVPSNGELSYPLDGDPPWAAVSSGRAEQLLPAARAQHFAWRGLKRAAEAEGKQPDLDGAEGELPEGELPDGRRPEVERRVSKKAEGKRPEPEGHGVHLEVPLRIRIPEIYGVVRNGASAQVVMEYVRPHHLGEGVGRDAHELSADDLPFEDILNTIILIAAIAVPTGTPIGRMYGVTTASPIEHPLFREGTSESTGRKFKTVEELNDYFNELLYKAPSRSDITQPISNVPGSASVHRGRPRLNLGRARLVFTRITGEEFQFTEDGSLCVVGFHNASILTLSLMFYALKRTKKPPRFLYKMMEKVAIKDIMIILDRVKDRL